MCNHQSGASRDKLILSLLFVIFVSLFIPAQSFGQDKNLKAQARSLINLLDYVSQDYAGAVSEGKIISVPEFNEMMEFSGEIVSLFDSVSSKTEVPNQVFIATGLKSLHSSIEKKEPKEVIANTAQQMKKQIMLLHLIDIAPVNYPDITAGQKLYSVHCETCHGKDGAGNGPGAAALNPKPTNFLATTAMQYVSPLQVFNTVRLGVQGTSMRAFDELSDDQAWQIAFYVKSLPYQNQKQFSGDSLENVYNRIKGQISLSELSHLSDIDLESKLPPDEKAIGLASVRLHRPSGNENTTLNIATSYMNEALQLYKNNQINLASQRALLAYLDGVEPVEQQLRAIDANIVNDLESKMNAVRASMKKDNNVQEVEQNVAAAKASIEEASKLIGEQNFTFWFSFLIAASILLREGLEAVLIIVTILSLLKSLKATSAMNWVHGGWITAVALGVASWFFTDYLISFGSQNRELVEAFGSIIAVLILIYVGFWLHNKTEAKKWHQFINTQIKNLLSEKKMFGLAAISFVVVFREAFESILFLSSMQLQVGEDSQNGVWMGAVSSILVVILLAFLLLRFSVHIPIRKLFQYSALMIMIFAIVLAGQAVHAFQEAGYASVTNIPLNFHSAVLGIFPTVETYVAQTAVAIIFSFMWWRRTAPKKIESDLRKA